mmetsp:Transcript_54572/g.142581  ORF Transcript_54572/g.142581 Transcript_54572/m.142581 type:complete len:498 (+) Transcript_54572:377-1870(+)
MWGDRHMTWVRLKHKPTGASVFFANTHGPLANCGDELGENWLAGVKANMQPDDVAFMTGDFNCGTGSTAVDKVKQLLVDEVNGGIDHIMTNVEVVAGGPKAGQPSDHPLIRGTFRFSAQHQKKLRGASAGVPAEDPTMVATMPSDDGGEDVVVDGRDLAPVASATVAPLGPPAEGCGATEEDVDYAGGDLPRPVLNFVDDAAACSRLCRDTDGCKSFTYGRGSKACYLKNTVQLGRMKNDCCVSGLPACSDAAYATSTTTPALGNVTDATATAGDASPDNVSNATAASASPSNATNGMAMPAQPPAPGNTTGAPEAAPSSNTATTTAAASSRGDAETPRGALLNASSTIAAPEEDSSSGTTSGVILAQTTTSTAAPSSSSMTTTTADSAALTTGATSAQNTTPSSIRGAFVLHKGVNCWSGHGADALPGGRDMIGVLSLRACQAECAAEPACEGVVVFHGEDPGNCWLRWEVDLSACQPDTPWDLWLLNASNSSAAA